MIRHSLLALAAFAAAGAVCPRQVRAVDAVNGNLIRFNDNGAWSWFEDERAIVNDGQLLVSSVADESGIGGLARSGNVEVSVFNLATRTSSVQLLNKIVADDHNSAALLARPDGRYLAVYSNHSSDQLTRYRISTNSGDATSWQPEQTFNNGAGTTYSNVFHLSAVNTTYNFTRAAGFDPHVLVSSNQGSTWSHAGWLLRDPNDASNMRPYLKYASNDTDEIHFITTEAHPRDYNNGIYHGYLKGGLLYRSDGTLAGAPSATSADAAPADSFTSVFGAQPTGVIGNRTHAWTTDMALDSSGKPYVAFTTRIENTVSASSDHHFFYGRWDGTQWNVHALAKAGAGLYSGEGDYTGLVALDPDDPDTLYLSSNIHPATNAALGNHEIFRGRTTNGGATWSWTALTENSTVDNLRPIVPKWSGGGASNAVLWMRGTYTSYTNYDLSVVGMIDEMAAPAAVHYVDATTGNTSLASGGAFVPTGPNGAQGAADGHWHQRTSFGNGGDVFTADETATAEDAPTLRTTITGLAQGAYDVWAFFWSNPGEQWQIQAGLSAAGLALFEKQSGQHVEFADLVGADDADDGAQLLYKAYLGRAWSADGTLSVFVNDGTGAGASRTWYDGVGYAAVPEPASMMSLLALATTLLARQRRGRC